MGGNSKRWSAFLFYVFAENNNRVDFKGDRADCMTDMALEFFDTYDKKKPFFMTISQIEPHHQNFDGVKASLLNPNLDCYQELYRRRIPIIFYNNYYKNLHYPRVIVNDLECADQLVGLLVQAGHRHIASIFIYDNYQSIEKFQGTIAALIKRGVEFQDDYIKWCVSDEAYGPRFARSIDRFLRRLPKYTAVVCCNYMIYRLVRQVLEDQGKRVPEDCSLVCFDYSSGDWESEGITCSIHQDEKVGQLVATRLMTMIQRHDCEDKNYTYVLKPKIHIGDSICTLT